MPFYELFALARPSLQRGDQFEIIRAAATAVLSGGGVLADIKSYGERPTAYPIRPPGSRYDSVSAYQQYLTCVCRSLSRLQLRVSDPIRTARGISDF